MDIKLETALRKLKLNTEDIHEWERVYELAAKSNKAIQLTWQDGTTQIVRDVYTSTQRLGLVLSLQRWNIPLDPTYRGLYPVEIRGLKNISFVDKPGYIDDSMSHTVREHAVVKIRALLETDNRPLEVALRNLKANTDDIHAWERAYELAKRYGKVIRVHGRRLATTSIYHYIAVVWADSNRLRLRDDGGWEVDVNLEDAFPFKILDISLVAGRHFNG